MKLFDYIQREMQIKNYSRKTIDAYLHCLKHLILYYHKPPKKINANEIKEFIRHKIDKGISSSTASVYINAFNFLYQKIYHQPLKLKIELPKRAKKLPIVLSKIEIQKIIQSVNNSKHKLIISMAYASGLRVGEIQNLKISDLDLEQKIIHIKQAKGKKDRLTILSDKLIPDIARMIANKSAKNFVFESERGGKMATRTLQKIFKNALKKSGVKKPASFHCLRHSFATHLLENGTSIRYIQELLGHSNIQTTQIYTRVTNPSIKNITSPL